MKAIYHVILRIPLIIFLFAGLYVKYFFARVLFLRRFRKVLLQEGISKEITTKFLKNQDNLTKIDIFKLVGSSGLFGNRRG